MKIKLLLCALLALCSIASASAQELNVLNVDSLAAAPKIFLRVATGTMGETRRVVYDPEEKMFVSREEFCGKYGGSAWKIAKEIDASRENPSFNDQTIHEQVYEQNELEECDLKTYAYPYNKYGQIVFSEVVKVGEGVTADDIFRAANLYIIEAFKSADDVVQLNDKDTRTIIAKGWREESVMYKGVGQVWFTMKIQAKDGRFKVDIYQLSYCTVSYVPYLGKNVANSQAIAAELLTDELCFNQRGELRNNWKGLGRMLIIIGAKKQILSCKEGVLRNLLITKADEEEW